MSTSQIVEMRTRRDAARERLAELAALERPLTATEEQGRVTAEADVAAASRWLTRVGQLDQGPAEPGAQAWLDAVTAAHEALRTKERAGAVTEGDTWQFCSLATQARDAVLRLMDLEATDAAEPDDGDENEELQSLQRIFNELTQLTRAYMREPATEDTGMETAGRRARESATLSGVEEAFDVASLSEASYDLARNELTVTFLAPGFNRSGARYYKREAIQEAVDQGLFAGVKMYMNHASLSELRDRPERSLTDWVSTLKEAWVDPVTGAAKGKVKVVRGWFADFLKELQEHDALGDVGLSIFAQAQTRRRSQDGRMTDVVERFQRALSVDWVTEPGAGGRVEALWESYQPIKQREEEQNMLKSMTAAEALAQLRSERRDVLELLESERDDQTRHAQEVQEAERATAAEARIAELEAQITEREAEATRLREAALRADQDRLVREALDEARLLTPARVRVEKLVSASLHQRDGQLDEAALKVAVAEAIQGERDYADALLKEAGVPGGGKGITGLGTTEGAAAGDQTGAAKPADDRIKNIAESLAARFGFTPDAAAKA
jgi:hypothetical protein